YHLHDRHRILLAGTMRPAVGLGIELRLVGDAVPDRGLRLPEIETVTHRTGIGDDIGRTGVGSALEVLEYPAALPHRYVAIYHSIASSPLVAKCQLRSGQLLIQ